MTSIGSMLPGQVAQLGEPDNMLPGDVEEGEAEGGRQGEVAEEAESNVHFFAG